MLLYGPYYMDPYYMNSAKYTMIIDREEFKTLGFHGPWYNGHN